MFDCDIRNDSMLPAMYLKLRYFGSSFAIKSLIIAMSMYIIFLFFIYVSQVHQNFKHL